MPVYSLRYLFELCSNPVKLINFLLAKGLIKRDVAAEIAVVL